MFPEKSGTAFTLKTSSTIVVGAAVAVMSTVAIASGEPADWVQLIPFGKFGGRDGRGPYELADAAHAAQVIAATRTYAGSADPVVDYDHQTDFGAQKGVGGRAPASGWIKEMAVRDDGIWGRVEWTAGAHAQLKAGEYRYISPVFTHEKTSGRVRAILRAGLTNSPNLELAAVASAESQDGDIDLDKSKLAKALGLGDDATEEQIHAAITGLRTAGSALATVAQAAGLKADAAPDAIVTAINAARTAGDSSDVIVAMQAQINELKAGAAQREAVEAVDAGIKAGKITPAARDAFISLHSSDPAAFAAIVDKAPVIVTPGAKEAGETAPSKGVLSADEKAVCAAMNWDEAEFLKARDEEAA